jgi:mono/diheme cytochrome c family protein
MLACVLGTLVVGVLRAQGQTADGNATFKARCAKCHGDSGKSDATVSRALKVRPLANDAALARMTPDAIVRALKADVKHQGVGALDGLDDDELSAVAIVVKKLASKK